MQGSSNLKSSFPLQFTTDPEHIYNPWNLIKIGKMLIKIPDFRGATGSFLHFWHDLSLKCLAFILKPTVQN